MSITVLDLFSGIGGFSLGLTRAGFETVAFCEIDPYCRKILKKHWPGVPVFEDIKRLHWNSNNGQLYEDEREGTQRGFTQVRSIDVICGGFPCQPYSAAGKRRGKDDERHLWPEMFRLIQECNPKWIIGENVPGIINMGLDAVLSDLESSGYETETFIIPACAVNAPHRRDRVWIVANTGRERANGLGEGETSFGNTGKAVNQRVQISERFESKGNDHVNGNTPRETLLNSITDDKGHFARTDFRRITTTEWITEPGICSRDDGVPQRVARLRALGNSVIPYIPEFIGNAIMEIEGWM
jgi:DNA (cytosine-5)-methyltransferase 1